MTNPKEALEWYERKQVEARAMADRDCNNCKHNKADGCSRWECEYVPRTDALISRQDAIEAVATVTMSIHLSNVLCDKLLALPSADRPTGWIPVSERLPIPPTFCLVTTDGSHGDVIDIALYMSDGWHKASDVIAWMPLPEPYKGGDDE